MGCDGYKNFKGKVEKNKPEICRGFVCYRDGGKKQKKKKKEAKAVVLNTRLKDVSPES